MEFGSNGDLFVATGDKGQIFRVTPKGQGDVFFETDESHARSLALDSHGNLIVGTEPSGLVLRVSPAGQGFVLEQTAKREVTAVAVSKSGLIYAAAVGNRGSASTTAPPISSPPPSPPPASIGPGGATIVLRAAATNQSPSVTAPPPSVSGGSEVYRIDSDGYARRVWSHPSELVYSIALDAEDRPVIATGNRGGLYRLDSMQRYTLLTNLAPTQVTQLVSAKSGGAMYAITGNIGQVFKIGPALETEGIFESDLFDAGAFTYWGRLEFEGYQNGGRVQLETRSGNLSDSHKNWSTWIRAAADGRIQSPAARFLQYRVTLSAAAGDGSSAAPEVDAEVDVKYQAKNIAPEIDQIDVTPPNYKFPAPAAALFNHRQRDRLACVFESSGHRTEAQQEWIWGGGEARPRSNSSVTVTIRMQKGFTGVRWSANDENGDALVFRLDIRGVQRDRLEPVSQRQDPQEHYYSWDSTAFADGEYVVRITASDSPSNTPEQSLTASLESEPFLIDNAAPGIYNLIVAATSAGSQLSVNFQAKDGLSNIARAEYSVNGGDWMIIEPVNRLSDSKELNYRFVIDRPAGQEYSVAVRVADEFDNVSVAEGRGQIGRSALMVAILGNQGDASASGFLTLRIAGHDRAGSNRRRPLRRAARARLPLRHFSVDRRSHHLVVARPARHFRSRSFPPFALACVRVKTRAD